MSKSSMARQYRDALRSNNIKAGLKLSAKVKRTYTRSNTRVEFPDGSVLVISSKGFNFHVVDNG